MNSSIFASAVFTAGIPITSGGVRLAGFRGASGFLGLSARFSSGFRGFTVLSQSIFSRRLRIPGLVMKGQRTLGVTFATAATGKSLHEFTVKSVYTSGNRTGLYHIPSDREVKLHIYILLVQDIDGNDISLSKFKGKVLLIVNVASQCGLTSSNYTELSQLYDKYKDQGFEILAFPCNQFGGQEPGSNTQIKQFACTRFKAEFPIFDKVDVNGPKTAPVYQFLKASAGGFLGDLIKWNFEKFLIDKNGNVVERYQPTTSPFQIEVSLFKYLDMPFQ
ncbi:Putative glutathione peroxidase 7, chloroplastic [Dendrobium catenatum]|uniref:Glutathione peroxidase n=1 Tax=Dendrobium catenatum TaxID=906689 RepID=A0A2I0W8R7_9ASPA|nr:Putative glutathione peroxidase 7, chloroplastic [Dendrobium catenatum]